MCPEYSSFRKSQNGKPGVPEINLSFSKSISSNNCTV